MDAVPPAAVFIVLGCLAVVAVWAADPVFALVLVAEIVGRRTVKMPRGGSE